LVHLRAAAVQMECVLENPKVNFASAESLVVSAREHGADLIVLPELFGTGYRLDENYVRYKEPVPGPTTEKLRDWCLRYGVDLIVGSLVEASSVSGVIYNTSVLVGREGLLLKYRKIHLWNREKLYFRPGARVCVGRNRSAALGVGLAVCYDVAFPELGRALALGGATVICVSAAYGKARTHVWDIATRARALESGCYVVAANRLGEEKESVFAGHTRVVAPDGFVLDESVDGEGLAMADIDLDAVAEERAKLPFLSDLAACDGKLESEIHPLGWEPLSAVSPAP